MTDQEKVFIGVAWPYANNSLHLGHVAGSLLAPDIFARFNRMKGRKVLMVSGSDEHGTPIMVTAKKEGVKPSEIAERYHKEQVDNLERLGISFDLFFRTSDPNHAEVVHDLFLKLLEKDHIYKQTMTTLYCSSCDQFLPDRYVEGTCPHCQAEGARGDQCDECGRTLDPMELEAPKCKLCGSTPGPRDTDHFFLRLSAFQERLIEWIEGKDHWKPNVKSFTISRLKEGLKDRAITRDLSWGVPIPLEGMDTKRIYVWFEAVIGYLSTSKEWSRRQGDPDLWKGFWQDPAVRHYYFLGKDNIPFHTIIWPAMLMGYEGLNLPYDVPANEYLTMSKTKMSKSRGTLIPLPYMLDKVDPDALRYYICASMPEAHDTDFSFEDLVERNNKELLNTLGNFIHRSMLFTFKNYGKVPEPVPCDTEGACPGDIEARLAEAEAKIREAYDNITGNLQDCRFKNALSDAMALAIFANGFFQTCAPFKVIKKDKVHCAYILNRCLWVVKALTITLHPFLPNMTQRIWNMLGHDDNVSEHRWEEALEPMAVGQDLRKPEVLVKKLDKDIFEEEPSSPFHTLSLKVGTIEKCDDHPNAQKLQVLTVDLGDETRQIVTGLKDHYTNDELQGMTAVFVTNLKPAKLRGVKSNGMILAGEDGTSVSAIRLEEGAVPGEAVLAEGIDPIDKAPPVVTIEQFLEVPLKVVEKDGALMAVYMDGDVARPLTTSGSGKRAVPSKKVSSGARIR
jgi:methionyl-tRNA synthetase